MALDVEKAVENAIEKTLEEGQGEESKESEESKEIKEAIAYTRSWEVSSTEQERAASVREYNGSAVALESGVQWPEAPKLF